MHNNRGGVEPRGEKDVRPRPITGAEAGAGRLAIQGVDPASIAPRSRMGEAISSPTPGLALSYAAAMEAARAVAAKLHPPRHY